MNKFIRVTELETNYEFKGFKTIAVSTIANFGDVIFTNKTKHSYLVYKDTGLINSKIYTQETEKEISDLIDFKK